MGDARGRRPTPEQATTLVANIRRFLTGIGAPGGPGADRLVAVARRPNDPDVDREATPAASLGVGDNHAVYVGGAGTRSTAG